MLSTLFSVFHFCSSEKIAQKTTKRKNTQTELFSWLLSIFGQLPKSGARSLVKIICTRPKVKIFCRPSFPILLEIRDLSSSLIIY